MDGLPYQRCITAPTGTNMCACSIYLMSHAHDAHGEIDSLADLRDASRERLLTEIGMLRKETQFAEFQTFKTKYEQEILSSRDAIIGMSAEIGELKAQHRIDIQNARQSMMNTPTWRAGSQVLKPLNLMKKLLRKK
jgi:hypothetical protein